MEPIQLDMWGLVLAYGAIQGYVLALILFVQRRGKIVANVCLGLLVLFTSFQLSASAASLTSIYHRWPHLLPNVHEDLVKKYRKQKNATPALMPAWHFNIKKGAISPFALPWSRSPTQTPSYYAESYRPAR